MHAALPICTEAVMRGICAGALSQSPVNQCCQSPLPAGERIGKLIRNAEKAKTPVMCVVGEKEASSNQLSVRTYGEDGDRGVMPLSEVITRIQDAGRTRMPF